MRSFKDGKKADGRKMRNEGRRDMVYRVSLYCLDIYRKCIIGDILSLKILSLQFLLAKRVRRFDLAGGGALSPLGGESDSSVKAMRFNSAQLQ